MTYGDEEWVEPVCSCPVCGKKYHDRDIMRIGGEHGAVCPIYCSCGIIFKPGGEKVTSKPPLSVGCPCCSGSGIVIVYELDRDMIMQAASEGILGWWNCCRAHIYWCSCGHGDAAIADLRADKRRKLEAAKADVAAKHKNWTEEAITRHATALMGREKGMVIQRYLDVFQEPPAPERVWRRPVRVPSDEIEDPKVRSIMHYELDSVIERIAKKLGVQALPAHAFTLYYEEEEVGQEA